MTASGWKTAPPQVGSEVASVTNSACQISYEASPRVSDRFYNQQAAALKGAACTQSVPALAALRLHLSVHLSFPIRTLSAPPGERPLVH